MEPICPLDAPQPSERVDSTSADGGVAISNSCPIALAFATEKSGAASVGATGQAPGSSLSFAKGAKNVKNKESDIRMPFQANKAVVLRPTVPSATTGLYYSLLFPSVFPKE
jgi:hypothetical protein